MTVIGYHFTGDKLRDDRPIPPIGEWLEHDGPVIPCESGLHASPDPFDALQYVPGPILHRVELDGDIIPHGNPIDKWVARRRRILASVDLTDTLRQFARQQALSVIHLWDAPTIVREYLETGDASKRAAAEDAAWAAARAAGNASTNAAARAARNAAWAARNAAEDAAWAAAWAARNASTDAEGAAARKRFNEMAKERLGEKDNRAY